MIISLLLLIIAALALWLFIKILTKPIKWVLKLLLNAAIGFAALFVVNFLGAYIGLHITVSWLSALVTGFLGVPGIIILLLIENIALK
ncbi:MAG: pro-sigmaK processing inhibitor BofA family protein [Oscillospiraceae bacterium]|nr:pro-sigmaK processing inhibitor BofA family protein [Oscillospiraceae bacterium]